MISAILLAAGRGTRLGGKPKALLRIGALSFLAKSLAELSGAELGRCVVVTGAYEDQLQSELLALKSQHPPAWLQVVQNPLFAEGLLGSIQAGIAALPVECEAALITLVDLPLLTTQDYQLVLAAAQSGFGLVRPVYGHKPAHPVLIARRYFSEIMSEPASDRGCAFLFERYASDLGLVYPEHQHGIVDIDSMEDYHAHITS